MKVQFTAPEIAAMRQALAQWGQNAQIGQTIEECAELIVALQKYSTRTRGPDALAHIVDEIADVEMMLGQMRLVFDISDDVLRKRIETKFAKLNSYLAQDRV